VEPCRRAAVWEYLLIDFIILSENSRHGPLALSACHSVQRPPCTPSISFHQSNPNPPILLILILPPAHPIPSNMAASMVSQPEEITAGSYVGFDSECRVEHSTSFPSSFPTWTPFRIPLGSQSPVPWPPSTVHCPVSPRSVVTPLTSLIPSAITRQIEFKLVKRGFQFNVMVVGQTGLGKSTLINTLFASRLVESKGRTEPEVAW
jgi:hypothetical protein